MKNLTKENNQSKMKEIDDSWILEEKYIHREIIFKNFAEALAFMNLVAVVAQDLNHHPDWKNLNNKVSITLQTHESNGISAKDFQLAKEIDLIFQKYVE